MNQPQSNPLGVGQKMINLSQGVKNAPAYALPVFVFVDEFQVLLASPIVNNGNIREDAEVML